ncbi:MAG: aspartate carbamoyltransferase regulatory subunit, partial [Clostridia bacterium]|nr:aspartate carbamoyltransferase regulatory subunit [Clostridia bacterium]
FDVLGYIDPGITVNIIQDGKLAKRSHLSLPERVKGIIRCKNPRCITSVEQELVHEFRLADREKKIYRCIYCEHEAPKTVE